jgi:hypothetical protein
VVARIYAGRLQLPRLEEMQKWEEEETARSGKRGRYHWLDPSPRDGHYLNFMYDWAAEADKKPGLENDGMGKMPARWGPFEFWQREKVPDMRTAFSNLSLKDRSSVRTLEELGFTFQPELQSNNSELLQVADTPACRLPEAGLDQH